MSRSYHTTQRLLEEIEKYDYSDAEKRAQKIERLKERLYKKRLTKRMTKDSRRSKNPLPLTSINEIPIHVQDESEFIHYPANVNDIRSILDILPKGVTDGLTLIELCLGEKGQSKPSEIWVESPEPDPYVGRDGYEILPGVYHGSVLGTYYPNQAKIRINAYVGEQEFLCHVPIGMYLRMLMLMTLVHEIAHHYDFSSRIARGRWMAEDQDKVEIYAEKVQHDWFTCYVLPFLKESYPVQWNAFHDWIREKVGLEIPIEILVGDPRTTVKGGHIVLRIFFDTGEAFQEFVTAVENGQDLQKARFEFARNLHYAEYYKPALQIIELLFHTDRNNIDVLILQADIFNHLSRYEEALDISRQVLQRESEWVDAFEIQVDAYMGLGKYSEAVQVVNKILEATNKESPKTLLWQMQKAKALIELGQYKEAESILSFIEQLTSGRRVWKRRIEHLRKKCRRYKRRQNEDL
ncbi:MAG: hypothetical protein JXA82_06430 [Sedimentisphaerales bacterium]|nr:hypothetical protein [Sedimentisphaerales bacterium]